MQRKFIANLWILISCLALSSCTLEHSRQSSQRLLQQADLIAVHQVQRSAEWAVSPSTPLCQMTAVPVEPVAGAVDLHAHYQRAVDAALYQALGRSFVVEAVNPEAMAAAPFLAACELLVQARVVGLENIIEISPRHGPERSGQALPRHLMVQVTIREVASGRLLDVAVVRSQAGVLTPVGAWLETLADESMAAYVAQIAALGPKA